MLEKLIIDRPLVIHYTLLFLLDSIFIITSIYNGWFNDIEFIKVLLMYAVISIFYYGMNREDLFIKLEDKCSASKWYIGINFFSYFSQKQGKVRTYIIGL